MDKINLKLLKLVQKDNRLTAEQLGEIIGLSPSACQKRLTRMRSEGIIEADVSVISPKALGLTLTMIVNVTLEREQPQIIDQFKQSMRESDEVMQCFCVTGNTDFVVIVNALDMEHFDKFAQTFLYGNPHIRHFETSIVIDRVKTGFNINIDIDIDIEDN